MANHLKWKVQMVSTSTTQENPSVTWDYESIHYQQLCEWYLKLRKNILPSKITILRLTLILLFFKEIIHSYKTNVIEKLVPITEKAT